MVNDSMRTPKIIGGLPYRSAGSDAVSQDRLTVPNPRSPTFVLIKRCAPSKLEGRLCAGVVERKAVRGRRLKHVAIASGDGVWQYFCVRMTPTPVLVNLMYLGLFMQSRATARLSLDAAGVHCYFSESCQLGSSFMAVSRDERRCTITISMSTQQEINRLFDNYFFSNRNFLLRLFLVPSMSQITSRERL